MSVAWRNVRDEWMKEIHAMMKRITECEVKSSCAFLKSNYKAERRMMMKLRGVERQHFRLRWEGGMG